MQSESSPSLHPKIRDLLSQLRHQVRRYIVWESVLVLAAIVLAVFWIAFLIDYLPVRIGGSEMPRSARAVVLAGTFIALLVFAWRYWVSRAQRALPDDSLALLIERHHPDLAGTLVTAVQLEGQPRTGDSHSPAFLSAVHRKAVQEVDRVDLKRVFRREPITRKLWLVIPLLTAVLVLAVASPKTFGRAISRLTLFSDSPWPRRAALEMVGVEVPVISASQDDEGATELVPFEHQVLRLARGSNSTLRIRAAGEDHGHQIPDLCTVTYIDDDGTRGQSNLRRVGRLVDGYQSFVLDGPPLTSLARSLSLTIRGLDDRLRDFRIEAIDPPAIATMQMQVRYPNYLRVFDVSPDSSTVTNQDAPAFDQELSYQAGVRIREGSNLTLVGTSSVPLGEVDVFISSLEASSGSEANPNTQGERTLPAAIAADALSFTLSLNDLREATSVRIVPRDQTGISAQAAYRYFIGVVRDQVPETSMRLSGIGSSITPIAKLPIEATATDDYGVESMQVEMRVRPQPDENATQKATDASPTDSDIEPHVVTPQRDREGIAKLAIDLRELTDQAIFKELKPGDSVTINTTAKDRFDLGSPHVTHGELIRLQVVTPEQLLATLERRELEFRSRLEQSIDETRRLRQSLTGVNREASELKTGDEDKLRSLQRLQLRVRQAELQAAKTTDELAGIVSGIDDLLLEMLNNRIDSVDRRERLQQGVRDPLSKVVTEPLPVLRHQITELERTIITETSQPDQINKAVEAAVATNDQILLQLSAVLEKMLDLESFNEILDLMRGLIQDQESLLEETEDAQQKRVLDLFK
ncbi:hypothetical protein SAMN06265222_101458 [Neorhodopirellula lusitana]|uniref:Polyketide synthase-like protein n=1 Tax=Neorhodopirellula lusitana TaxID=445327 RepID=A0ABY1PQD0_9BACT|nr:polyketide synthase [Neorhodopirellula lusitana]SMP40511.1 hypothetical protein SAMN06265222_101458 [Neorhodopirellula lusitana]